MTVFIRARTCRFLPLLAACSLTACAGSPQAPYTLHAQPLRAAYATLVVAARANDTASLRTASRAGAPLDMREGKFGDRLTPLGEAVKRGHIAAARTLLELGADVNAAMVYGTDSLVTPLMIAADRAEPAMVELLLTRGADVRRRDSGKDQALNYALKPWGKPAEVGVTVDLLAKFGAPLNEPGWLGMTPLMQVSWLGPGESVEAIVKHVGAREVCIARPTAYGNRIAPMQLIFMNPDGRRHSSPEMQTKGKIEIMTRFVQQACDRVR